MQYQQNKRQWQQPAQAGERPSGLLPPGCLRFGLFIDRARYCRWRLYR
jgi:hypothetical protein